MAIYNAKYISDMNKADPDGSHPKNEGDNAIREIKDVLQTTFPNFETGVAVTASATELNSMANSLLPRGAIVMWAGDQGVYPDGPPGWTICDGRARKSGGGVAPDLRGKFIMGAKPAGDPSAFLPSVGDIGGNNELNVKVIGEPNLYEFTTQGHSLTSDQLPAHTHALAKDQGGSPPGNVGTIGSNQFLAAETTGFGDLGYSLKATQVAGNPDVGKTGNNSGTGAAHTHKFTLSTTNTGCNIPVYYAALYLIKD